MLVKGFGQLKMEKPSCSNPVCLKRAIEGEEVFRNSFACYVRSILELSVRMCSILQRSGKNVNLLGRKSAAYWVLSITCTV